MHVASAPAARPFRTGGSFGFEPGRLKGTKARLKGNLVPFHRSNEPFQILPGGPLPPPVLEATLLIDTSPFSQSRSSPVDRCLGPRSSRWPCDQPSCFGRRSIRNLHDEHEASARVGALRVRKKGREGAKRRRKKRRRRKKSR